MAKPRIVILGAGLGGAIAAFEIKDAVRDKAEVSVVSQGDTFHFVPSNPWVAVHWRKRQAIEVNLPPVFKKRGIVFSGAGAKKVVPAENRVELNDGGTVGYDYLVIATGPDLAFDEIAGLGPHGGGDTKGLLESEMRERHIKWITNAKVTSVEAGMMHVEEVAEDGSTKATHDLPFAFSMMLPAFRGVDAVRGVEGLTNPRGFIVVDKHQRNPSFPNVFALGVCVAIAPTGKTPLAVGVPKTGFMIESMVTAIAKNLGALVDGKPASNEATWNAICLADFGDGGVAFVAQPQIPPRNVN